MNLDKLSVTDKKIISLLLKNNGITDETIAEQLEVTLKFIQRKKQYIIHIFDM